jgi:hypothetical protein
MSPSRRQTCDLSYCGKPATWFAGREYNAGGVRISRGHPSCDEHLAEGCQVTLTQLALEAPHLEAWLALRPIIMTDDL